MYEIRKWVLKPVLKEVLETNINCQALEETIGEIIEKTGISTEDEFFELYEVEDLETGLVNGDVLTNI